MNNKERFNEYNNQKLEIWKDKFVWHGDTGDERHNTISIVNFVTDTLCFDNVSFNDTKSFYNMITSISVKYVNWCISKSSMYSKYADELGNFFKGVFGEIFFMYLLQNNSTIMVKSNVSNKYKMIDFSYVCPRLIGEEDFGVDLTGMISEDTFTYNCAIQVKFWNPDTKQQITNKLAQGVFADAICNNFISKDYQRNIVICWLGTNKQVSRWLARNEKLYNHIIFIDNDVLDVNINNMKQNFWNDFMIALQNIKNYQ